MNVFIKIEDITIIQQKSQVSQVKVNRQLTFGSIYLHESNITKCQSDFLNSYGTDKSSSLSNIEKTNNLPIIFFQILKLFWIMCSLFR